MRKMRRRVIVTKVQKVTCCGLHDRGTERSGWKQQPHQTERKQKSNRKQFRRRRTQRGRTEQPRNSQSKEERRFVVEDRFNTFKKL